MAQWILKNIPKPTNGKKVVILSNMDGMDTYFRNDTSWIETHYCRYYERGQNNWDYYITFGRFISSWQLQNDKWPPSNAIYKVTVPGDVPIGVILGRKNNESALAYTAFKNEQYQEAITHYEASLKVDNSDEMVFFNYAISLASVGRIAEAINAINAATKIDASRPEFYEMQARIYKAIGDKTKEQESITKMQTAMEM
jgi:tetratricopeptide (TPR) repeat protein